MNVPEFFVQRWEAEQPAFAKVIRALPANLGYRPHERSTSAGDLAWQLAEEQRLLNDLLETGEMKWDQRPAPKTTKEIADAWDRETEKLRKRLHGLDDKRCASPAKFSMGGSEPWTDNVGNMLWGFLFDMVHHRGQLAAYIRPMGGKVPAIYGPSADDNGR